MRKLWGKFLHGLAFVLEKVLGFLITILEYAVDAVSQIRSLFTAFFGCIALLLLWNPFSFFFLADRSLLLLFLILFGFPLLGRKFASFLHYWAYVLTEFLYDKSAYFLGDRGNAGDLGSYGRAYRQKQEEEARARAQAQQAEWNRAFEEWFRNGFSGGFYVGGDWDSQGPFETTYGTGAGPTQRPGYYNPTADFIQKYQRSCAVLGLSYDTDLYQVKLAYRKLAKKYHPDLNPAPDAGEKFREVNEAYAFLSEENLKRYRQIQSGRQAS